MKSPWKPLFGLFLLCAPSLPAGGMDLNRAVVVLTWDRPVNEQQLNWRKRSRLAEVWLLKQ